MARRAGEDAEPPALVAAVLQAVRLWTQARSVALFACRGPDLRLVLADAIDQGALDEARRLWPELPLELRQGAVFRGRRDFMMVPCAQDDVLRGLLYLEGAAAPELPASRALSVLAGMLAETLGGRAAAAAPGAGAARLDPDGANLLFLLERNEWNVTRVARLLGITRTTVYNRLRRLGVPRKRVRLTPPAGKGRPGAARGGR